MLCPNCAAENDTPNRFCLRCGYQLAPPPASPRRPCRWIGWVAALALLLLLGGGGLPLLFRRPISDREGSQPSSPPILRASAEETEEAETTSVARTFLPTAGTSAAVPSLSPLREPAISPSPEVASLHSATTSPTSTPPATATPPPVQASPRPPSWTQTANSVEQAIEETIRRYSEIKAQATGPGHDDSQLATVLVGEALADQQKAVKWQREHGAYYITTLHWLRIEWSREIDATHAQALVTKLETLLYYSQGSTTPSAKASCQSCEYSILYSLELIGGRWYIADKEVQD